MSRLTLKSRRDKPRIVRLDERKIDVESDSRPESILSLINRPMSEQTDEVQRHLLFNDFRIEEIAESRAKPWEWYEKLVTKGVREEYVRDHGPDPDEEEDDEFWIEMPDRKRTRI